MASHSSVLAWRIPGMGQPGGLPSMGSHRVGHDRSDLAAAAACCLHCLMWAFSSCGAQASHCGGFSCFRARALGHAGFRSCGAWT